MSEQSRKFVADQLQAAGVTPTDDALLDYAMMTVAHLCKINEELHKKLVEQRPKRRRKK